MKQKDFILASKYDRLKIGFGEAGVAGRFDDDDDMSGITNSLTTPSKSTKGNAKKKESVEDEATKMIQTVFNLVNAEDKKDKTQQADNELENQSLSDLTDLHKMYMTNFAFHKENGTLSEKRKLEMLTQIDYIFSIIESRSSKRKRSNLNMDDNSNSTVS